jgi:hypothetical protein
LFPSKKYVCLIFPMKVTCPVCPILLNLIIHTYIGEHLLSLLMKFLLINLTKCQIHHTKQIKLTSQCVIINVIISKHYICKYHNKACSITPSNGAFIH